MNVISNKGSQNITNKKYTDIQCFNLFYEKLSYLTTVKIRITFLSIWTKIIFEVKMARLGLCKCCSGKVSNEAISCQKIINRQNRNKEG